MSLIDNGGAIALKGFNYQKASIIFVMIRNFEKENFKVIPESREDFEIHLDEDTYFIQVKGTKKLSVSKLKSRPKGKDSIIEKNLFPGSTNDKRKIFLWDIIDNTEKELVSQNGTLIPTVFSFSDKQKEEIINTLNLDDDYKLRLNNQYIYITPFQNDLNLALTYLKGEMVDGDLLVNNDLAKLVLGELMSEIDQKSEIEVKSITDIKRKEIDGIYLKKIFLKAQQIELFDEILKNLSFSTLMKKKVKKEKLRIPFLHQSSKLEMMKQANSDRLINLSDDAAIMELRELLTNIAPEIHTTELSIAIAIDCLCDLGGESL